MGSSAPRRAGEEPAEAEVEVPLAMASDEERLATKRFDALDATELALLYRRMSRLELATPERRTRRYVRGRQLLFWIDVVVGVAALAVTFAHLPRRFRERDRPTERTIGRPAHA